MSCILLAVTGEDETCCHCSRPDRRDARPGAGGHCLAVRLLRVAVPSHTASHRPALSVGDWICTYQAVGSAAVQRAAGEATTDAASSGGVDRAILCVGRA